MVSLPTIWNHNSYYGISFHLNFQSSVTNSMETEEEQLISSGPSTDMNGFVGGAGKETSLDFSNMLYSNAQNEENIDPFSNKPRITKWNYIKVSTSMNYITGILSHAHTI